VESEAGKRTEGVSRNMDAEVGVAPGLLSVRSLLMTLPKAGCPIGFEMRLQRRLAGSQGKTARAESGRSWGLGWAGVGLGFAAAILIGVVTYNANLRSTSVVSAPVAVTAKPVESNPQTGPNVRTDGTETGPTNNLTTEPQQQLAQKSTDKAAIQKDSSKSKTPTELPENLYHVVGGNGR
jgi:hypothetical protein